MQRKQWQQTLLLSGMGWSRCPVAWAHPHLLLVQLLAADFINLLNFFYFYFFPFTSTQVIIDTILGFRTYNHSVQRLIGLSERWRSGSKSAAEGRSSRGKMYKAQVAGGTQGEPATQTQTQTRMCTHRAASSLTPPSLLHFSRPRSDCDLSQFPLWSGVWCTLLGDFDCRTS